MGACQNVIAALDGYERHGCRLHVELAKQTTGNKRSQGVPLASRLALGRAVGKLRMAADIAQIGNEIWDPARDGGLEVLATATSSSAHSLSTEYMVIGGASLPLANGRYRRAQTDEGQTDESVVWRKDRSDVRCAQPSPFQGH